jgi:ABC-type branched-subunit amino acid transport system substrate-binding protein
MGRHPRKIDLATWFDGEGSDRVGGHVLRCHRCQRHVDELARLRSWLRAQPFVAMRDPDDAPSPVRERRRARRPLVAAAALAATVMVVAESGDAPSGLNAASSGTTTTVVERTDRITVVDVPDDDVRPVISELATPESTPGSAPPASSANARPRQTTVANPLRLGLIVPTTGALAAEGAEVTAVVRQRVDAANAAGGVAGVPIELATAPAENPDAVSKLGDKVDVLVGGFGTASAPGDTPWLLPADPAVVGPAVVPAELTSKVAGSELAGVLRRQGLNGVVGVVVGSGPDSALAAGLASKTATTSVTAKEGTTCVPEVTALRKTGAVALAVAGPPDLAARCMKAAFQTLWLPAFGTVLAPSAAYAGLHTMPEAIGARTVLGLPWPTADTPGAARFRSTTRSTSYRALVSYAATELAIEVARQKGGVSVQAVEQGAWRSDLFDMNGLQSRVNNLVAAFLGTWLSRLI